MRESLWPASRKRAGARSFDPLLRPGALILRRRGSAEAWWDERHNLQQEELAEAGEPRQARLHVPSIGFILAMMGLSARRRRAARSSPQRARRAERERPNNMDGGTFWANFTAA